MGLFTSGLINSSKFYIEDKKMIHIGKNEIPKELRESKVVLYGGGYTGRVIIDLFKQNNLAIEAIIDDDEGLQGEYVKGIPVISYSQFVSAYNPEKNIGVVLTSIYGKAILKKLNVFPELKIYELFDWYSEIIGNKDWIIQIATDSEIENLKCQWNNIKSFWADEVSVRTLDGLIKYFDSKDLNDIAEICTDEEQYFIPEVVAAISQPLCVVDGGAYRGELLHSIQNNHLDIEKWYCFEPDQENYELLTSQAVRNKLGDRQECIKKGLWNKSGILYFQGGNATGSRIVPYETSEFVKVDTIDDYIGDKKCNFIKMDIEGAELPALKGGIKVIKRERPILAICIYHSINDYYTIPSYLIKELENYKFYVRHHALICNETVLYCIPQ